MCMCVYVYTFFTIYHIGILIYQQSLESDHPYFSISREHWNPHALKISTVYDTTAVLSHLYIAI